LQEAPKADPNAGARPSLPLSASAEAGFRLVPQGSTQNGKQLWSDEYFDAARDTLLSSNESRPLESEHHLVDGWWAHAEVSLQVGLGRRSAKDARIGIDEGQILTLLGRENWGGGRRHRYMVYAGLTRGKSLVIQSKGAGGWGFSEPNGATTVESYGRGTKTCFAVAPITLVAVASSAPLRRPPTNGTTLTRFTAPLGPSFVTVD